MKFMLAIEIWGFFTIEDWGCMISNWTIQLSPGIDENWNISPYLCTLATLFSTYILGEARYDIYRVKLNSSGRLELCMLSIASSENFPTTPLQTQWKPLSHYQLMAQMIYPITWECLVFPFTLPIPLAIYIGYTSLRSLFWLHSELCKMRNDLICYKYLRENL